jgi:D-sedoheptulose 7-phosphate isomerase
MEHEGMLQKTIRETIAEHQQLLRRLDAELGVLADIAGALAATLGSGSKILFCGNGGSAADAQHLAAELVGRYVLARQGLPAIALTTDTSILTAVSNDFGFAEVFARQVEALGRPGDILFAISTSGNSQSIVRAVEVARTQGMKTVAFTGEGGGKLAALADWLFAVPSCNTARVQEVHILAGHILCDWIDKETVARTAREK